VLVVAVVAAPSWDVRASWALLQAPAPRRLFLDFLDFPNLFLGFLDLIPNLIRQFLSKFRLPPQLNPLSVA
jgi:hypothetical protein